MASFGTNLGIKFAKTIVPIFYQESLMSKISNQDYEGELKAGGADRLRVKTYSKMTLQNYTPGSDMSVQALGESQAELVLSQKKAFNFPVDNLLKFENYAEDPQSPVSQQVKNELLETIDSYLLSFYADVASGNRVGTDYTTGTVEVTVTTGAVAGSGTTFTSSMVGKGFKATGHTAWYRIKTYSSGTAIVIEDDKDDETSAYTGGAISAGATYTVEANTPIALTSGTVYANIAALKKKLDKTKTPKTNRWLVVESGLAALIVQMSQYIPAVDKAYGNVVENGLIGRILGFDVYESEQVNGDNTNGYWALAGHKSFITFAWAFSESRVTPVPLQFANYYQGLNVYGGKVVDERRKAGAALFYTA